MNLRGTYTLFRKEVMRFMKVMVQTVLTPVITSLLYLLVFSHLLEGAVEVYPGVGYAEFLVPGLVMMTMIQNAFANASSSLIQSKQSGNLVFLLLSPISAMEFCLAFIAAAVFRGLLVGVGVFLVSAWWVGLGAFDWLWLIAFGLLGSAVLGALGLLAGVWAEKYEQLAAFSNFIIVPLSFLSGVFYSIHSLPPLWHELSKWNPFFYIIDGFRYGFVGVSDVSPGLSLGVAALFLLLLSGLAVWLVHRGYKLRD